MNNYLLGLVEEMRLFLPELRGLMILTPDGLPFDFVILNKNSKEDPIIIGGLISFAVSSLSKALEGFGDENFDMTYVKGEDMAMVAGKVGNFYVAMLADADAKLGPLFMEFNRRRVQISRILEEYVTSNEK